MQAFIEKAAALNDWHWHGGYYQWVFYAGIVLVLIFEKRKTARIIFGWLPVVYLLCIYNPLFMKAMDFAGAGGKQYFVRLFSFMPLMYTIAKGMVCLLEKTEGWLKLILVCAACAVLCLTGYDIFSQGWYVRADNYAKVSKDTYEVMEALKKEGDSVSVAPIYPVTTYLRQAADFVTPYAREQDSFGDRLMADPPDVIEVMETAGERDMDFILTCRTDETIRAFLEYGYEPYALTENLAVYRVADVDRRKRTLNEKRQVTAVTEYDAEGNPKPDKDEGYMTVTYEYDSHNYRIKESYLDGNGDPFVISDGYASACRTYSERGLLKSCRYLDADGKPVLYEGRYETRCDYDLLGNPVRESYYDADGNPMEREDVLYAARTMEYNSDGLLTDEKYFNTKGEPTACSKGYAERKQRYKGEEISWEGYYDTEGKLIVRSGGYAAVSRDFDARDNLIREIYLDEQEKPVRCSKGYAGLEREYDENGNMLREQFLDENGKLLCMDGGYALRIREFNENNKVRREAYFGENGEPVLAEDGYHAFEREYNESGRAAEEHYYGTDDEPILTEEGYHGIAWEYDDSGHIISEQYYGTDGRELALEQGNSKYIKRYDKEGNMTAKVYMLSGRPVMISRGYASFTCDYDAMGNLTRESYFDEKGKPVTRDKGYAEIRYTYDPWSRVTEESHYDTEGNLTDDVSGVARIIKTYDGQDLAGEIRLDKDGNTVE